MPTGDRNRDTICAVSTPHGVGGVSIIRVSGEQSVNFVRRIASFFPENLESHRIYYGTLKSYSSNDPIDEVLVSYFRVGRSFTGEDVVEISCHGSPAICYAILKELISFGARTADRGEFTFRAFMNGRLDLIQAESVLSLIESQTQQSTKLALRQLKGSVSRELEALEDQITWVLAHAEASIDFSNEDLDVAQVDVVLGKLDRIESNIKRLLNSYKSGRLLKDGIKIALVGVPNVGKSSILNLLVQEDAAIVTDIPGTTRDVVKGQTSFDGVRFIFLDTAGLRDSTTDVVEQIGISRSLEAIDEADHVGFVYDLSLGLTDKDKVVLNRLDHKKSFVVGNKKDIAIGEGYGNSLREAAKGCSFFTKIENKEWYFENRVFFICANDIEARSLILGQLSALAKGAEDQGNVVISHARHFEMLEKALQNTIRARGVLQSGLGFEFLALEFKEALIAVHEILGKRFDDQIMDRVFKEFCIGK